MTLNGEKKHGITRINIHQEYGKERKKVKVKAKKKVRA